MARAAIGMHAPGVADEWADWELPRLYFELPFVGMAISSASSRRLLRGEQRVLP